MPEIPRILAMRSDRRVMVRLYRLDFGGADRKEHPPSVSETVAPLDPLPLGSSLPFIALRVQAASRAPEQTFSTVRRMTVMGQSGRTERDSSMISTTAKSRASYRKTDSSIVCV